ncbi:hypothetical protein MTO96_034315 [Rhipicephalus appendiculatus]
MGKNAKDKKAGKSRANNNTGNHKGEFLRDDLGKKPKLPSLGSDTDSSGDESGDSTKTGGASVEERRGGRSPLQRLLKADKKLFKALSILAAEAAEKETVARQIDLIINEVAKMKSLILEATHEVGGLQGELRATRGTRNTGSMPSMAEVVRTVTVRDPDRQHRPIRPTEAIVRELQTNAATGRMVEVTRGRKKLPQIKIVGISEDITDEEIPARLVGLAVCRRGFHIGQDLEGKGGENPHFLPSDYGSSPDDCQRRRLKSKAVPTIFEPTKMPKNRGRRKRKVRPSVIVCANEDTVVDHDMCTDSIATCGVVGANVEFSATGSADQAPELVWTTEQAALMETATGRDLHLLGDGRCDSPGHSAKYLTYSLMDAETAKILHFVQVQVGESADVKTSPQMEQAGLIKALAHLRLKDLKVASLTTDRHPSIRKYLRDHERDLLHELDSWHVVKGLVGHIVNVHSGHEGPYHRRLHDALPRKEWLDPRTPAYQKLKAVVLNARLLKDIAQLSSETQTSSLESFHALLIRFAPKSVASTPRVMSAR